MLKPISYWSRVALAFALAALPIVPAHAETGMVEREVGKEYRITMEYETSSRRGEFESGRSSGRTTIIERVIAKTDSGFELGYDFPREDSDYEDSGPWEMPARVSKSADGIWSLLNEDELIKRRDEWLKAAGMSAEACDEWIFTWNAFKIECDPQSAIRIIKSYEMEVPGLRADTEFTVQAATLPAHFTQLPNGNGGHFFQVDPELNQESARRSAADQDIIVSKLLGDEITLQEALIEQSKIFYSGTTNLVFETDSDGHVVSKVRTDTVTKIEPLQEAEVSLSTRTYERTVLVD